MKLKIFSRSVIPVVYIKTTVDQRSGKWQSKNTTISLGKIIYQLHVSALEGHLQVGIRQRKISLISIGMGGRDLVYKCMGFVVESVLDQACVRLVCTSVALAGLGLEALVAACQNGRLKQSCAAVEGPFPSWKVR